MSRAASGGAPPDDGRDGERLEQERLETERVATEIEAEIAALAPALAGRLEAEPEDIEAGVARLVLTLVELLRQVMEHQAVRRMEGGGLTDEQVERLGLALQRLEGRLEEVKAAFGLEGEDLNVDLGPLGKLL
ncbi:MAG: gas vesicle protein K [Gemmatimonadota bacterium]